MLIVDAGPLIAAAFTADRNHARCVELLSSHPGPLVVPALVITEVAYLLGDRSGVAESAFAHAIAGGELLVEAPEREDWPRIAELVDHYADLRLGIVDASVVATCERLGQTGLATLDHRHFSVVRPRHCAAFDLLPD